MRLILVLWMCVALPLQAWGGSVPLQPPCPMEAAMVLQGDAQTAGQDIAMDDCCNDAETFQRTGQMCKIGQECPAPTGLLAPSFVSVAQAPAVSDLQGPVPPEPPRGSPTNIWRPPSLL